MPWEKQFDVNQTLERAMQDLVDATGINRASLRMPHSMHFQMMTTAEPKVRYQATNPAKPVRRKMKSKRSNRISS